MNNEDAKINVHFDSNIEGKDDQVRLKANDGQGKEINISSDGIELETREENDKVNIKGRSIIPQSIKEETSYIEVYTKVALSAPSYFIHLNDTTPIEIKAARQDIIVGMEKITTGDKTVTYHFHINNRKYMNQDFTFFMTLLVMMSCLWKNQRRIFIKSRLSTQFQVINRDDLRFRAAFDISKINDFNLDDYLMRINMGSLNSNIPFELDRVKINLH